MIYYNNFFISLTFLNMKLYYTYNIIEFLLIKIDFKPEYKNNNQFDGLPTSNALQNMSRYYFVAMRTKQQDI